MNGGRLGSLYQEVAHNAIHNEGGRADDPRCHPGTREELIDIVEKWADSPESSSILWISGPAGGGKTAIMKTIMERRSKLELPTVSFFFFRSDPTRCSAGAVVPTMLYQLLSQRPLNTSKDVDKILTANAHVLSMSIAAQMAIMIELAPIIRKSLPTGTYIILLIDGLDECNNDVDHAQEDVLRAFADLVAQPESPFRLLLASRPEPRITMAFGKLPLQARTIFLDEEYLPAADIRKFLHDQLAEIKKSHPGVSDLPINWPPSDFVDDIVEKSCGQFILAATVARYLAQPFLSPQISLERVRGIQVSPANNSPFAHIDSMYLLILKQVEDLHVIRHILSMPVIVENTGFASHMQVLLQLNPRYTRGMIGSAASRLSSILELTGSGAVRLYHSSLNDFLCDRSRSGQYWLDKATVIETVLVALWDKPTIHMNASFNLQQNLFNCLPAMSPQITHKLCNEQFPAWTLDSLGIESPGRNFLTSIWNRYGETGSSVHDITTYNCILRQFIPFLLAQHPNPSEEVTQVPNFKKYYDFYKNHPDFYNSLKF